VRRIAKGYRPTFLVLVACGFAACAQGSYDPVAPIVAISSPKETSPLPSAANGNATIAVPTFAPVTCTPQTVEVIVGSTSIVDCSAADYGALFSSVVADPTIASVSIANPSSADFYAIVGLLPGSTTVTFATKSGQSFVVSVTIVAPLISVSNKELSSS
jgi:hypothetical protein